MHQCGSHGHTTPPHQAADRCGTTCLHHRRSALAATPPPATTMAWPPPLGGLLLLLLLLPPSLEQEDCKVTALAVRDVTATQANLTWRCDCASRQLATFKLEVDHEEYFACTDKTKKARFRTIKISPDAREWQVAQLLPYSRYSLKLKAIPRKGRASAPASVEVSTPHRLPQLQVQVEEEEEEVEEDSLSFSWTTPLSDPRVSTAQEDCTQRQSRLGQVHYRLEDGAGERLHQGNLSLETTHLRLEGLRPDTGYSLHIFLTDSTGHWAEEAGAVVTRRTAPGGQDPTLVIAGVVGGLLFLLAVLLLGFLLRRCKHQHKRLPTQGDADYISSQPILRPGRGGGPRPSTASLPSARGSTLPRLSTDPLPPRPGQEPLYQSIPDLGQAPLAPLARGEEEEEEEYLQPRVPTPSSVTEEDEDGYLKPNFHR